MNTIKSIFFAILFFGYIGLAILSFILPDGTGKNVATAIIIVVAGVAIGFEYKDRKRK